jgi:GNAT superfamily N-acetyltransferase
MALTIQQIASEQLPLYAQVSIAFEVTRVLRVEVLGDGFGGLALAEQPVDPPYIKDYDREDPEGGPADWPRHFDTANWGIFLAMEDGRALGGATVAWNTAEVHMLEGRRNLAVLWDIRVHPEARGRGVGSALFRHATQWARERTCTQFKVETQNINVAACHFYRKQGCVLGAVHRFAYAGHPSVAHEVMLLWYLNL